MFFKIFLITLLGFSLSEDVLKYKCAKELKIDRCYYEYQDKEAKVNTIFVKPCGSGERCTKTNSVPYGNKEYNCIKSNWLDMLKEGDSCTSPYECESRICINGKCSYLEDYFYSCTQNYECGLNSYCDDVCLPINKKDYNRLLDIMIYGKTIDKKINIDDLITNEYI